MDETNEQSHALVTQKGTNNISTGGEEERDKYRLENVNINKLIALGTESQRRREVETYGADDAMLAITDRNDVCEGQKKSCRLC